MNMKRFLIAVVSSVLLFAHAGVIKAGPISQLSMNQINELEDNNFESFFKRPNDGSAEWDANLIQVGDRFLGVIDIQAVFSPPGISPAVYNPGGSDPTLTAVFALEAARVVTTAANAFIYYKPVADWSTAFGLNLPSVSANTVVVFYDDVTANELVSTGSIQAAIDSYVGNNKVWEFGFKGADFDVDGVSDIGEFVVSVGNAGTEAIPNDQLSSIANIVNLSLINNFTNVPLAKHTYLSGDDVAQPAAVNAGVSFADATEFQGIGRISTAPSGVVWDFQTDTDFYIAPIPEPSSIVLWGIGALGLGLAAARRRKQALAS